MLTKYRTRVPVSILINPLSSNVPKCALLYSFILSWEEFCAGLIMLSRGHFVFTYKYPCNMKPSILYVISSIFLCRIGKITWLVVEVQNTCDNLTTRAVWWSTVCSRTALNFTPRSRHIFDASSLVEAFSNDDQFPIPRIWGAKESKYYCINEQIYERFFYFNTISEWHLFY